MPRGRGRGRAGGRRQPRTPEYRQPEGPQVRTEHLFGVSLDEQAREGEAEAEGEVAAEEEPAEPVTLTYEDDDLLATVAEREEGALPEGVALDVRDITPSSKMMLDAYESTDEQEQTQAKADTETYVETMERVSEQLAADDIAVCDARVYDIRLLDEAGNEVEPFGQLDVTITHKERVELAEAETDSSNVGVVHVPDEGDVQEIPAAITSDDEGRLEETCFVADSFSAYVVFSTGRWTPTMRRPTSAPVGFALVAM